MVFLKSQSANIITGIKFTHYTCIKQAYVTANELKTIFLLKCNHCFTFRIYASWQKREKSYFVFSNKKLLKDKVQMATFHLVL